MRLQTVIDISSRGAASAAEIVSIGRLGNGEYLRDVKCHRILINPVVRLVAGPPCSLWALRLSLREEAGQFRTSEGNVRCVVAHEAIIAGADPLFPQVPTRAATTNIELWMHVGPGHDLSEITATLSAGAAPPVTRTFRFIEDPVAPGRPR